MKYTALTIGPILKSLLLARRTKELWAASYFFSYFMGEIIKKLNKNDAVILPFHKEKLVELEENIQSAGIFPDRLILEGELFDELNNAVDDALKNCISQFSIDTPLNTLKTYINAHIVEFEYTERENKKGKDNLIFQAYDYLAICELNANYSPKDNDAFLKMLQRIDQSDIYRKIFTEKRNYPSIIEIATQGVELPYGFFSKDRLKKEDGEIWKDIENEVNLTDLKTSHKYIAIVQADGDNISKIVQKVAEKGDKKEILKFSEALSTFSLKAANEIAKYGGTPVYVGGDDLLFFAPIINEKSTSVDEFSNANNHIFKLIAQIDTIFKKSIISNKEIDYHGKEVPSMSYGISITYYKYPMHEALRTAQNLLFSKAKKANNEQKNAIAFRVLKHSGQFFEAVLHKTLNPEFIKILNADAELTIHSLIYNFERHSAVLKEVIGNKDKLENFFNNFYDEKEHEKAKDLIESVSDMMFKIYNDNNHNFEQTMNQMYAQLRIVKFLNTAYNE